MPSRSQKSRLDASECLPNMQIFKLLPASILVGAACAVSAREEVSKLSSRV